MISDELKDEASGALKLVKRRVDIIANIGDDETSSRMAKLLNDVALLSDHIVLEVNNENGARPSFEIVSEQCRRVRFAGLPLGDEFTSLILAILWAGGHPPRVPDSILETIRRISVRHKFELYYSLHCKMCPDMVQNLILLALNNQHVSATFKDVSLFQDEYKERELIGVPTTLRNGKLFSIGLMDLENILLRMATPNSRRISRHSPRSYW